MPFLQSLFCLNGYDNRLRFFTINFSLYLFALCSNSIFSAHNNVSIFILILLSVVCAITTQRRLKDAALNKSWLLYPCCSFFCVQIIIMFNHSYAYLLLILPILLSLFLLTYPAKKARNYILGYSGPINLNVYVKSNQNTKQQFSRIEPTLYSQENSNKVDAYSTIKMPSYSHQHSAINTSSPKSQPPQKTKDFGEKIREKLLNNKKTFNIYLMIIGTVILGVAIALLFTAPASIPNETVEIPKKTSIEKFHPVTLPDNFKLLLSKENGVIISWLSNDNSNTAIWSLLTAQGDKQCQNLEFNNGNKTRVLLVNIETNTEASYFAYFSPLDTKNILKNIALGNKFSLCGYSFSLKGSQAALGKHAVYSEYIDY